MRESGNWFRRFYTLSNESRGEGRGEECVDEEGSSPKAGCNTQKREEGPV